jgi:hypothetical protein
MGPPFDSMPTAISPPPGNPILGEEKEFSPER